ncbi:hypothetical protein [Magnetospira sp. QH-2]|uniref:DUF7660 family protein n=1 Tax=Magnetospira sp. (strain QH-2) TaxID=1288970 RepID=UPI0003E80F03|nr:hypothetical protein [Magnetospira sp. QH-2]CCQ72498.1 conserved protein of unknown function [Magnetospira sp. QH-2]
MQPSKYPQYLDSMEEQVRSSEDLSKFVALLEEGYLAGAWEKQDIDDYLGGVQGILNGLEGFCANNGLEYPEQPTWAWMARILHAAFFHS